MKVKLIFSAFLLSIMFLSTNLYAFGIGGYTGASKGSYEWEYNISNSKDPIIDSDLKKIGFGFILDTNLASDSLFNYRLQIGYSAIDISNDHNAYNISGKDYYFYNSFGFGILCSGFARLWFGPQFGMGYMTGKYDLPSSLKHEDNSFWTLYCSLGIVAGVNFNIGKLITLGLDGGFRGAAGFGTADMASTNIGVQVTGTEGFINLCVIFRLNDNYRNR